MGHQPKDISRKLVGKNSRTPTDDKLYCFRINPIADLVSLNFDLSSAVTGLSHVSVRPRPMSN